MSLTFTGLSSIELCPNIILNILAPLPVLSTSTVARAKKQNNDLLYKCPETGIGKFQMTQPYANKEQMPVHKKVKAEISFVLP